jgi:phosphoglycerate dehydrogenase-like enzyme
MIAARTGFQKNRLGNLKMKRREFLAASAAASTLVATRGSARAEANARRIVLGPPLSPAELADVKTAAPDIEYVVCRDEAEAIANASNAGASYAFITPKVIAAAPALQWVQQPSAGVEHLMEIPDLLRRDIVLTNMQRAYAPEIADQAIAYLLAFTRGLTHFTRVQSSQEWRPRAPGLVLDELMGKTMLIIGLGGIGTEIARRACAFGMRILATDPKVWEKPSFVEELHKPSAFHSLLPRADVVASAVPLTKESKGMIGEREFAMMKTRVILINVSRGKVVDTEALIKALDSKHVAAAGLDVTDPEPLPKGHALWSRNVIITPHTAGQSPAGERRRHLIFCENLRRFSKGEALLNVVDKTVGY